MRIAGKGWLRRSFRLFAALLCLGVWAGASWALTGVSVADDVNLRQSPSLEARKVGKLSKGEFVEIVKFWRVDLRNTPFIDALMTRNVNVQMDDGRVVTLHRGLGVKCRTDFDGSGGQVRFRVGAVQGTVWLSRAYWKPMDGKWFYVRSISGERGWVYHEFVMIQ
jgi:hypothetical protein